MKKTKLLLAAAFALTAAQAAAAELAGEIGTVIYLPSCSAKYAFSYFDGSRLQNLCIVDTPEVPLSKFQSDADLSQCTGNVEVVRGTASQGQIRAQEIRPDFGCDNNQG